MKKWYVTLLLVCAAAFLLAALISLGIFERIPHVEDEAAYLFQAQVFAQERLSVPTPPYPSAYWSPFVVDYQGQRFGKYPPGYPLLLSLGVRLGQPWAVNALLGALSLWFIAQLGRHIYSPTAGLLAAALGLTCPVFLAMSGTLLSHPASLFFTVLFLWALARWLGGAVTPGVSGAGALLPGYAALAGLALGCLLITRPYDALAVGLPFGLYVLARGLRGERRLLGQGMITAGVVLLFGLLLLAYWHRLTGEFANPYRLVWPYDRPGFGPDVGAQGHTLADGLRNTRLNLRTLATGWLGWPGLLNLLFLWAPFIWRPRERWNYLLLAGFVSVVDLHIAYWYYGGRDAGFPRYYYPALPMLLLLTGRGIEAASHALGRLSRRALTGMPIYLALAALVLYSSLAFLPPQLSVYRGKYGITAAPLRVAQDAGLTNALVFVTGVERWYDFAVFFAANSPTLDSEVVYAIYRNQAHAQAVKASFPQRRCSVQTENRLLPCDF